MAWMSEEFSCNWEEEMPLREVVDEAYLYIRPDVAKTICRFVDGGMRLTKFSKGVYGEWRKESEITLYADQTENLKKVAKSLYWSARRREVMPYYINLDTGRMEEEPSIGVYAVIQNDGRYLNIANDGIPPHTDYNIHIRYYNGIRYRTTRGAAVTYNTFDKVINFMAWA